MASESRWNVPASTSCWQRRSYSSAEPSHQWIDSGLVSSAISSTQSVRASFCVGASGAAVASVIVGLLSSYLGVCNLVPPAVGEVGVDAGLSVESIVP